VKKYWWLFTFILMIFSIISFCNAAVIIRVAILPPGTTSPFHSEIAKGAQEKGEAMGFRVEVQAPERETDFNGQVRLMRSFIAKKVQAISVNAIDEKEISVAIKEASEAKIPVFVHNSLTPIPNTNVAEYIGYNQRNGGRACGEYAARLLKGHGHVFILNGIPGFHQIERTGGFLDAIKKYPGITIAGEKSADWERDKAIDLAMQALKDHPEIDLFFGNSDEMAIGAAIAARNMGKKVYTIGIDGNPITLDKIAEGFVTATLGVYPDKIGEQIIFQMDKYFKNQKIPLFLETPAVVVDKSNLEDYKAGKLWTGPKLGKAEELPDYLPKK
jgi:ABC-type sugar transport system substrate-binding protein